MAVTVTLVNKNDALGEFVDYNVTEDATPLTIGDSSGSVGQLNVTTRAKINGPVFQRSGTVVGDGIHISDTRAIEGTLFSGRGEIDGQITEVSMPGERINITAETLLARLNTDRTAKPFFGSFVPPQTTTSLRTNLCSNPSRETNLNGVTLNNGVGGTAALTRGTDGGFEGAGYARTTWSVANTGVDGGMYDTITGIEPDISYTFSGYYRATRAVAPAINVPAQRVRLLVRFYNASNVQVGPDMQTEATLSQGQWTRLSIAHTAGAGAVSARLYCISVAGTGYATWKAGDTLDSDAILAERGPLLGYFSGASDNTDTVDPDTGARTVSTYTWNGTVQGSTSLASVAVTTVGQGYDATQGAYFRYLCGLVDLHVVSVEPEFEDRAVAYPGWTGNVWKYMKDFAAAIRGEVALVDGVVTLRKPRVRDIPVESINSPTIRVSSALSAQFVTVNNYNSRWGTDEVVFKSDTVYQVETSGMLEATVTVPHFLTAVNNPQVSSRFDVDYDAGAGQYTVVDSQGLIVDPLWWTRNGGRIEAELSYASPNEINIRVHGAKVDSGGYVGPYRIARLVGADEAVSALTLTGVGVLVNKEVITIRTGVSTEQTSTIDTGTIDNVFLSNANLAYTRGLDAACAAAGPTVLLTGSISSAYVERVGQEFGLVAGGRIRFGGNIFRVTNVSIRSGGLQFTALADMVFSDIIDLYSYTFSDFNSTYPGITFAAFNTLMSGKTFAAFNTQFGNPDFNRFNAIYAGATFNDHATYPYIGEVINATASTA